MIDAAKGSVKVTVIAAQALSKKQLSAVQEGIVKIVGSSKVAFTIHTDIVVHKNIIVTIFSYTHILHRYNTYELSLKMHPAYFWRILYIHTVHTYISICMHTGRHSLYCFAITI